VVFALDIGVAVSFLRDEQIEYARVALTDG